MDRAGEPGTLVRFGPFEVDLDNRAVRKHGIRVRLQAQPFLVLAALLENPGNAVSREELRRRIWPDDTFVNFEHGLNTAVTRLRQALGDSAGNHRYIETVPKHGYCFIGQVESRPADTHGFTDQPPAVSRYRAFAAVAAAVTLAAGALAVARMPSRNRRTDVRPVPLTALRGFEANPAVSPDGNHVAFTWNGDRQDNFDIYVMRIGSGTPVRLTSDPAEDASPAWSPDGRTLAFLRRLKEDRSALLLIPASGGAEHWIAETRQQPWFAPRKPAAISWTPDGRSIAASHREAGDPSEAIYLFSVTGEKRRLTSPVPGLRSDNMPAFSPDGRALAYCRLPGGFVSEICVLPLGPNYQPAGPVRQLTSDKRWSAQPLWTRDGRSLRYLFSNEAGRGVAIRTLDVLNPQNRAEIPVDEDISEISGGSPLVAARQTEDTNVWRVPLPGPGDPPASPELFISSTRVDQTARYSPDGSTIVFNSSRSGSREIWISKADGRNPVRMTWFNGPAVGNNGWSPDGQWIAFHARPEGTTDIFVMPAAGGEPKRLTTNNFEDHNPSYSRDGRWIYFTSRRSGKMEIWKMPSQGGEPFQLTSVGGALMPVESADGKNVFFHHLGEPGEIWSVPSGGGAAARVIGPTHDFPVGFAVTAEGIYYGAPPHRGNERYIQFYDFAARRTRPVAVTMRPFHVGMSVSPDLRYLLYDQYDEIGSDLMLLGEALPEP